MNPEYKSQVPIGYWFKHIDEAIVKHVNRVLTDNQLTHFRWQVLNIVHEAGRITKAEIFETMRTFVEAAELDDIINEFVKRGWMIRRENGGSGVTELELTGAGKEGHHTIFSLQSEIKKRALRGIGAEEYATAMEVLQRIGSNLE